MTEVVELKKPVVAVQRAVEVLRHLGRSKRPAGVNDIARSVGIVPSTCLHILRTLVHEGMVVVDSSSKQYRLGPALLRLARDMVSTNEFVRRVQPLLEHSASNHRVTTVAVWLDGSDRVIVVAKASAPVDFSIEVNVGSRFPIDVSAIGLCLAATSTMTEAALLDRLDNVSWQHAPQREHWLAEIENARTLGYAVDSGHYLGGVTVVAAPVIDHNGQCVRMLAGVGLTDHLRDATLRSLGDALKRDAELLSGSL